MEFFLRLFGLRKRKYIINNNYSSLIVICSFADSRIEESLTLISFE